MSLIRLKRIHSLMKDRYMHHSLLCATSNVDTNTDTNTKTNALSGGDHLVVLAHGLLGTPGELDYLGSRLRERGVTVLDSAANSFQRTLEGVDTGGERLAEEVRAFVAASPALSLQRVSFVGNSMGGLFARYAIALLFEEETKTIAGLRPHKFMTIATPHIGVKHHTLIEEYGLHSLAFAKPLVGRALLRSGRQMFLIDEDRIEDTLLFRMATDEKFLAPLKAFSERRAYANLRLDFMVPLGTAAFVSDAEVDALREKHRNSFGIVETMHSPAQTASVMPSEAVGRMIFSLDGCAWEKVLVSFAGNIPLAHNKISALQKYTGGIDRLFGFHEGQFVMDHAAQWLVAS